MSKEKSNQSSRGFLDALRATSDHLRVQAHLLSLDAKKRWDEFETELNAIQASVERDGEQIAASTEARFRELAQGVKVFLSEVDGVFELATPVRKLMKTPVACSPEDSLNRVAQIMWDVDCGVVPVVSSSGSLVGMITDRDLCMAAYTRGATLGAMTAGSVMSKEVHSCGAGDSIGHAVRVMAEKQVRRLPVIEDGKLVGLISLADVAQKIVGYQTKHVPACLAFTDAVAAISTQKTHRGQQTAAE